MKIAYGTYAMPRTRLEEALPFLRSVGYDGVEICVSPRHPDALPPDFDPPRRERIRALLSEHRLEVPAMMVIGAHLWTPDEEQHRRNLELIRETAQLGRDFGVREPVVVSVGIGGKTDKWDAEKPRIFERLREYAAMAAKEGFIIAGEAHCGAAVDRTSRALEAIRAADSPNLQLHFDIVHFFLAGDGIEECVRQLVPITAHTHITDAQRHPDGSFDFHVLGDGELDATTYMRAMAAAGWDDHITLEVSARVWSRDGYDSEETARRSYRALAAAFEAAGVAR